MKNDIFNLKRFGRYFSSDIRTCSANYGLSLITIAVLFPLSLYIISTAFNLLLRSTWNGPDMGLRFFVFVIAMFCIIVTMPVKCYGRITEKQYGSLWLNLPASKMEKFISMLLMTCIVVPITGVVLYLGIDSMICAFDHTCGRNIIAGGLDMLKDLKEIKEVTFNFIDENITVEDAALAQKIIGQVSTPWIYIDEIFTITLPFLLGAIYFRKGKTVKTFICIAAFSTAVSIVLSPFMIDLVLETAESANENPSAVLDLFSHGIFKNLALLDTISDTIVILCLGSGIWFRIKTLKH